MFNFDRCKLLMVRNVHVHVYKTFVGVNHRSVQDIYLGLLTLVTLAIGDLGD